MPGLTGHGIIAVIDRLHEHDGALLGNIAHDMINSADVFRFRTVYADSSDAMEFQAILIRR